MGLLITHHDKKGWNLMVREKWLVDTFKEALVVINRLMLIGIEFKVTYGFEVVIIEIEDVKVCRKEYTDFNDVLQEVIQFKREYGCAVINDR